MGPTERDPAEFTVDQPNDQRILSIVIRVRFPASSLISRLFLRQPRFLFCSVPLLCPQVVVTCEVDPRHPEWKLHHSRAGGLLSANSPSGEPCELVRSTSALIARSAPASDGTRERSAARHLQGDGPARECRARALRPLPGCLGQVLDGAVQIVGRFRRPDDCHRWTWRSTRLCTSS